MLGPTEAWTGEQILRVWRMDSSTGILAEVGGAGCWNEGVSGVRGAGVDLRVWRV